MPWVKARLRDQIVYARATADGSFVAEGGRVEVRYNPSGKAYQAGLKNLAREASSPIFPDNTCSPTEAAPVKSAAKKSSAKKSPKDAPVDAPTSAPPNGWLVYADGACSGNPGPAGLGVVIRGPND